MSKKFGWHSGTVHAQDGLFRGDVTIQDDLIFGDVSAGVLAVTGGIDMTGTTSAIGINLYGGTFATADIKLSSTGIVNATTAFQLGFQNSTYLYSTSAIKSAEKGIVSLYCESLGSAINTDNADRTAFLIRSRMGADAESITTGRNAHALDVLMDCDYDYAVTTGLRNADIRGARIQAYGHNNVSGAVWGAYINAQLKAGYTFNGQIMEGVSSFGAIGAEIRLETANVDGTITIGTAGAAVSQVVALAIVNRISCTTLTGNMTGIWIETPYETGGTAVSGTTRGIYFETGGMFASGTATGWDIGIDLSDSCVVGIDIGACTTGISVTGASTTAISITGAATDGIKIATGAMTDGIEIASACTNGINISGTCSTAGIVLGAANKLEFRDTGLYMYSSADGQITVSADTGGIIFTLGNSAYDKIQFGGAPDWGVGATGALIDGTGWDCVTLTVGHLDSGDLATSVAAAYHAMTVTVSQTTHTSIFGTWTELYFKNSVAMTGADNAAAVWGQVECGTGVTGPDQSDGDFMAAGYFNFIAGDNFTTGSYVNGVRVQSEVSSTGYTETASTYMAGLEILTKSGNQNWTHGIYISGATTGITIGTVTKAFQADSVACASGAYGMSVQSTLTGASVGMAAYFQGTVNGTPTGDIYAVGQWMNVTTAPGAHEFRAVDVGIWTADDIDNAGATYIGLTIDMQVQDGGGAAGAVYPMRFNCDQAGDTPTAWFWTANNEAIAMTLSTANTADQYGSIAIVGPFGTKYIRVYDT